jgi:hypothetical protein
VAIAENKNIHGLQYIIKYLSLPWCKNSVLGVTFFRHHSVLLFGVEDDTQVLSLRVSLAQFFGFGSDLIPDIPHTLLKREGRFPDLYSILM